MEKYDVAIIGAGLGGLQCAFILAKAGKKVIVLEKNKQYIGGCLQTFVRNGQKFDTGFHYVGGLDEGQPLNRIFKYFDLLKLPWHKMDSDCFDEVFYQGRCYKFCNGYDEFQNRMIEYFPNDVADIQKYMLDIRKIGDTIFDAFSRSQDDMTDENSYFNITAEDYLSATIHNPTLRNVLSGTSPKMSLSPNMPLYHFLQINSSFIQSAYRIKGGGMQIAESLAKSIEQFGGKVVKGATVTRLIEQDEAIKFVEIDGKETVEVNCVVSDVHPKHLLSLLQGVSFVRKINRRSPEGDNGFGMFTANIKLKPNTIKYQNRNIYIHETDDIWTEGFQRSDSKPCCALVSFSVPDSGDYAQNVDILTPMLWDDVAAFDGSSPMNRPNEYNELKQRKLRELIDIVEKYIPGFDSAVECVYTSTPLTYKDYTNTANGSSYGLTKKMGSQRYLKNIYLCGQNAGLHGILGVSMTSFLTTRWILGEVPQL